MPVMLNKNPLLPGMPDPMDLMPSPVPVGALGATLMSGASPSLQAAFKLMEQRYPKMMKLVNNIRAIPAPYKMEKGQAMGRYYPLTKNMDVVDFGLPSQANQMARMAGVVPVNPTQNALGVMAHEAGHAWQHAKSGRILNMTREAVENQADRFGRRALLRLGGLAD